MFKLRTADLKIKGVYDCSNAEHVKSFRQVIASSTNLTTEADKKEADKKVVAIEPHYCYVVVSGLHGDEANANGDFFRWSELLKKKDDGEYTFKTWIGKPVLENHDSKAVRGEILDVWPIQTEKSIDMLHRVDERINPNLVKGIRNGSQNGTSMGVMVGHSYCSVCKNLAYDESGWCDHLSPKKLNLKGRKYTGQDGRLYKDKIGQIVYEDNRDLHGVEDSFITLGEPADSKALAKQVFASKDTDMPKGNNKAEIEARRADLAAGGGITQYTGSVNNSGTRVATTGAPARLDNDPRLIAQIRSLCGGLKTAVESQYNSSIDVVDAIKNGSLKKAEAVNYAEKLNLVTPEEVENLTIASAYQLLEQDANSLRTAEIENQMPSTVVSDESTVNKAKPEANAPTPDGSADPKDQMPSSMVSNDSDVNSAKPEKGMPSPDGKVNQHKLMPTKPGTSDVNSAKPENKFPAPTKLGTNDKSTVNSAKPEESGPTPDGKVNPDAQMPSSTVSDESTVNKSKPEDGTPAPKGTVNPKAQMPAVAQIGGLPAGLMDGGAAEGPVPPMGEDKPSGEVGVDAKPSGKHDSLKQEVHDAVALLADLKEVFDNLENKLNKKEKKSKLPKDGEAPAGGEKGEDKPSGEKKDSPKEKMESSPVVPMKAAAGYKVEHVADTKNPTDSYYVVSKDGKDLFSVSVKQAWETEATAKQAEFNSAEYAKVLKEALDKQGAREVFKSVYASKGTVLAQQAPSMAPSGAPAPAAPAAPGAGLPDDKFNAPADNMNVSPDASQNISNDDTQKQSFMEVVMASLAAVLSATEGATASEAVDEMRGIFSDEAKAKEFEGRLAEKVDGQKRDIDTTHSPNQSPTPTPAGGTSDQELNDVKNALASLKTSVAKILPEFKKVVARNEELESQLEKINEANILKARTVKTLQVAQKKASVGLIDSKDVEQEAFRLAKLSDEELNKDVTILQNSLKIAKNINKSEVNNDSTNTEGKKAEAVLSAVPSHVVEEVVPPKTFSWSKGYSNTRKA